MVAPGIVQLAQRIEEDIRQRQLRPGHPYHTTAETARMLGVNTSRANRALQLLANRGVLWRRQRSGTIVAERPHAGGGDGLQRLHLLAHQHAMQTEGLLSDGVILGMQAKLPGAEIRHHYLPGHQEQAFIDEIVDAAMRARGGDGFVLFRCSVTVQRALAASGLPMVVSGGVHASIGAVAAIDRDQHQIGVELGRFVRRKRCSRFLCLMRDSIGPGDHRFASGLTQALAEGGVAIDRLAWRWMPADDEAVTAAVAEHLTGRGKLGVICRNEFLVAAAERAVLQRHRPLAANAPRPVLAMADCFRPHPDDAAFPFPRPKWSAHRIGSEIATLLIAQAEYAQPSGRGGVEIRVPVQPVAG